MSELPQQRARASAAGAKEQTWSAVRDARSAWADATRAHEQAPPDAGFRARLRSLSDAAAAMRDAHARALDAGLAWRPIEGSERARPPYELRPGTGRRGPDELWARFDAAVERLNTAAGRHSASKGPCGGLPFMRERERGVGLPDGALGSAHARRRDASAANPALRACRGALDPPSRWPRARGCRTTRSTSGLRRDHRR